MEFKDPYNVRRLQVRPDGPTVWAILVDYDYEGNRLRGIAADLESAQQFALEYLEEPDLMSVNYEEFEVIS